MYAITWNYLDTREEIEVTAFCVREDLRNVKMLKSIILSVWLDHPHIKYYKFHRRVKYPGRPARRYSLIDMFEKEIRDGIAKSYSGNTHTTTTR
jgi:hypothetical protein